VPVRVRLMVAGIRDAVARGDESMRNLTRHGEPERTERALAGLLGRVRGIEERLSEGEP
jgi:hypothetical protein